MSYLEQVHGEVGRGVDGAVAVALAEVGRALGEEVEGSLRLVDFEARDVFCEAHDEVTTALEGLTHIFHALLRAAICCFGCFLADAARTAGVLTLQFVACLDNPVGGCDEADTPASHGVCLAHSVDDDHAVADVGELCYRFVMTYIVDVFVDFVGDDYDVGVFDQYVLQAFELGTGVDRACGVGRRAEDEGFGAWGDGCLELCGCNLEVLLDGCLDEDGCAFGEQYHLWIAHPVGGRDDDLVALSDECHDGVAY